MRTLPLALAACAAGAALAACGSPGTDAHTPAPTTPAAPTTQTSATAAPATTAPQEPGLLNPQRRLWDTWTNPSATVVAVEFLGGQPECHGAYAEVAETADTVTVNLYTGTPPGAEDMFCTAIAVPTTVEVPLAAPLGDREVRQDPVPQ